ncbi:hypothetical protein HK096_009685 [Nowakowskiella sp. JEL0078]|nr:hypothetical protein HK096_009685 [Nowakowskiella sp. JEL0078]
MKTEKMKPNDILQQQKQHLNHHSPESHDGLDCVFDSEGNCPLVAIEDLFSIVRTPDSPNNWTDVNLSPNSNFRLESTDFADVFSKLKGWNSRNTETSQQEAGLSFSEKRKQILKTNLDADSSTLMQFSTLNSRSNLPQNDSLPSQKNFEAFESPDNPLPDCPQAKTCKRRKVCQACTQCRKSHVSCDSQRPCARCVKKGLGHLCINAPKKPEKSAIKASRCSNCPIKIKPAVFNSSPLQVATKTSPPYLTSKLTQKLDQKPSFSPSLHKTAKKLVVIPGANGPMVVPTSSPAAIIAAETGLLDEEGFAAVAAAAGRKLNHPQVKINKNHDKVLTDQKALYDPLFLSNFLNQQNGELGPFQNHMQLPTQTSLDSFLQTQLLNAALFQAAQAPLFPSSTDGLETEIHKSTSILSDLDLNFDNVHHQQRPHIPLSYEPANPTTQSQSFDFESCPFLFGLNSQNQSSQLPNECPFTGLNSSFDIFQNNNCASGQISTNSFFPGTSGDVTSTPNELCEYTNELSISQLPFENLGDLEMNSFVDYEAVNDIGARLGFSKHHGLSNVLGLLDCASKDSRCETCPYDQIKNFLEKNS